MPARKERSFRPRGGTTAERRLLDDIEADVFELWVGVSRLMSRLSERGPAFKSSRRQRGRSTSRPRQAVSRKLRARLNP